MSEIIVRFSYWIVTDPIGWWLSCCAVVLGVVGLAWGRITGGDDER